MLKNSYVAGSLAISATLAVLDYALFILVPYLAFWIHNTAALFVGIGLMICGYLTIKHEKKYPVFNYFGFLIGFITAATHVVKLVIGDCI